MFINTIIVINIMKYGIKYQENVEYCLLGLIPFALVLQVINS